jgi:hypothetical protein
MSDHQRLANLEELLKLLYEKRFFGLSYATDRMIRDETLIEKDIASIFGNCFRSRTS